LLVGGPILALSVSAVAAADGRPQKRLVPNRYIVQLHPIALRSALSSHAGRASVDEVAEMARTLARRHGGVVKRRWRHALQGFEIAASKRVARALQRDPRVASVKQVAYLSVPLPDCYYGVEENRTLFRGASPQSITCADPDPQNKTAVCSDNWALDRIDQRATARDGRYHFAATGKGVHIYFVDTGLYAQHVEFQGRIGKGYNATDKSSDTSAGDWDHGTATAAVAAGSTYGVAKDATIHMVKILDDKQQMNDAYVLSAIEWIYDNHDPAVDGPAVVSMSVNGNRDIADPNSALSKAVQKLITDRGILVVESAGNYKTDACTWSLAVSDALIVGGLSEDDAIWQRDRGDPGYSLYCGKDCGSNTGSCVDIWAPAAHIVSAWESYNGQAKSPYNTCRLSGTSFAAPLVAGAAALWLQSNSKATPAQLTDALLAAATVEPTTSNKMLFTSPELTQSASSLDLGDVDVGSSASKTLTLSSSGLLSVKVEVPTVAGPQAADFALQQSCSASPLEPTNTCTITVTFSPSDAGARQATLRVASSDPAAPEVAIALLGTGVVLRKDAGPSDGGGDDSGTGDVGTTIRDAEPAADATSADAGTLEDSGAPAADGSAKPPVLVGTGCTLGSAESIGWPLALFLLLVCRKRVRR
jgi:hypothetical protein